jgi:glutamine amidotransferase
MIAILDYPAGNVASVRHALRRLGEDEIVTADADILMRADRVIIPGVGEASTAMHHLRMHGIDRLLPALTQPVLGICLGLQVMCASTEEGPAEGLGIFPVSVKRFPPDDLVPHMGWNTLADLQGPLFKGVSPSDDVYFVHSYYAACSAHTTAVCDYILPFAAAMQRDNFFATQFHPEKSGPAGERILRNFLSL